MEQKEVLYDTCALLELQEKVFNSHFYVSDVSLVELENIKNNRNKDDSLKYKARHLGKLLIENQDKFSVVLTDAAIVNDDIEIIKSAYKTNSIFKTCDVACYLIAVAKFPNLKVEFVEPEEDTYSGFKIIDLSDDALAHFYSFDIKEKNNSFDLLENQYLIIRNNKKIVDQYKYTVDGYKKVTYPKIDSKFFGKVSPYKNDIYQLFALDSLVNEQITVLRGPAGTGKSYLSFAYMMHELETGAKDKIIVFCNTVAAKGAAKLGFYPGTKDEKLLDSQIGNFLIAKLGRDIVEDMILHEKIVLLPLADCRGFDSGSNAIIYITEAQNLDIDLMKLALQRVGENCKVILDGDDTAQVDLDMYAGINNGLRRVSKIFRGEDIYSEVTLQNIYRSKIAKIAEKL